MQRRNWYKSSQTSEGDLQTCAANRSQRIVVENCHASVNPKRSMVCDENNKQRNQIRKPLTEDLEIWNGRCPHFSNADDWNPGVVVATVDELGGYVVNLSRALETPNKIIITICNNRKLELMEPTHKGSESRFQAHRSSKHLFSTLAPDNDIFVCHKNKGCCGSPFSNVFFLFVTVYFVKHMFVRCCTPIVYLISFDIFVMFVNFGCAFVRIDWCLFCCI